MDTLQAIRTYTDAQQQMRFAMYDLLYDGDEQATAFYEQRHLFKMQSLVTVNNTKPARRRRLRLPAAKKPKKQAKAVMKTLEEMQKKRGNRR